MTVLGEIFFPYLIPRFHRHFSTNFIRQLNTHGILPITTFHRELERAIIVVPSIVSIYDIGPPFYTLGVKYTEPPLPTRPPISHIDVSSSIQQYVFSLDSIAPNHSDDAYMIYLLVPLC